MTRTEYYEKLLDNPNVQAYLRTIRDGEGTSKADGYRTFVGNSKFTDLSSYPHIPKKIKDKYNSTASGAYQINKLTWGDVMKALSPPDFSPHSQDIAAVYLLDITKGALYYVLNGDIDSAIKRTNGRWKSLPGASHDKINKHSLTLPEAIRSFRDHGGILSDSNQKMFHDILTPEDKKKLSVNFIQYPEYDLPKQWDVSGTDESATITDKQNDRRDPFYHIEVPRHGNTISELINNQQYPGNINIAPVAIALPERNTIGNAPGVNLMMGEANKPIRTKPIYMWQPNLVTPTPYSNNDPANVEGSEDLAHTLLFPSLQLPLALPDELPSNKYTIALSGNYDERGAHFSLQPSETINNSSLLTELANPNEAEDSPAYRRRRNTAQDEQLLNYTDNYRQEPGARKSTVNINKPMIDQLVINVQSAKEGVENIKHLVEEALLEILNSANVAM